MYLHRELAAILAPVGVGCLNIGVGGDALPQLDQGSAVVIDRKLVH